MIIVPEIETVVILVPRTGTGSLRRALAATYPKSFMLYRHMEADGVPLGYDRWRRVGVVRHPVDRLWSLYKFLKDFGGDHDPAYIERMRQSVRVSFNDWLLHNDTPFSTPYDSAGTRYWPAYTCRHPIAENRKSQELYLRPDLGTHIYRFEKDIPELYSYLNIPNRFLLDRQNATGDNPPPALSRAASECIRTRFGWDLWMSGGTV